MAERENVQKDQYGENDMGKTFEELIIWQKARELANQIFALTGRQSFSKYRSLNDQMQRAAVSVMANIAEGYERSSQAEFARFLFIAKGSCGELRSHLVIAHDQKIFDDHLYQGLSQRAFGLSAMISRMIAKVKNKK